MSVTSFAIEVAGRQLLIGGSWHLADNAGEAKAVRAENERDAISFELAHEGDSSIALYTLPPKLVLRPDAVSGGALVAAAAADVFVCQPIDAARCWVFSALRGRPLPGFDVVVRFAEVPLLLADAQMSGTTLTLVGDLTGHDCVPLQMLLAELEPAAWATAQIKKQKKWVRPAVAAAAVACLVGAGALGYTLLIAPTEPVAAAARSPAAVARPASAPLRASDATQVPELPQVPEGPKRFAASSSVQALLAAVHDIPTSINGWVASSVTCKIIEASCQITWLASAGATPTGASSIPGVSVEQIGPANKVATSQIQVPFATSGAMQSLNGGELMSLYSADTSFRANPGIFTLTVSAAEKGAPQAGDAQARVLAFGPVWAWQQMTAPLERAGVSVETLTLNQLDGGEPQIRITASAYAAPSTTAGAASTALTAMNATTLPAVAPR